MMATKAEIVKACVGSIRHWQENLAVLGKWKRDGVKETKRLFFNRYNWRLYPNTKNARVLKDSIGYTGSYCPLCIALEGNCVSCPLSKVGKGCDNDCSPWENFANSDTIDDAIRYARSLIFWLKKAKRYAEGGKR